MRILRTLLALVLVLAALAAVAAWTCPADVVYRWFGARLAPLQLRGVSGTLWRGHADAAELYGQALGAFDWTLSPASVLRAAPAAQVTLSGAALSGEGSIERLAGGAYAVRAAHLRLPAPVAAPALGIPALDLLGTIDIDIDRARFTAAWPDELAGSAHWRDAAVTGAAQARLGELQATYATAGDGVIHGTVRDAGGPLQLSGSFEAGIARYRAQARLAPRGDNPQLAEALQFIGQPQADGSRELLIEGRIGLF